MPVSIDCPSCKGRLLIPDGLWGQRFAGRTQRMTCKKCRNVLVIDASSAEPGSDGIKVGIAERGPAVPTAPAVVAAAPAPTAATSEVLTPAATSNSGLDAAWEIPGNAFSSLVPAPKVTPEVAVAGAAANVTLPAAAPEARTPAAPNVPAPALAAPKPAPEDRAQEPRAEPVPSPRAKVRVALPQPRKVSLRASGAAPRPTRTQPQPSPAKDAARTDAAVALATAAPAPAAVTREQPAPAEASEISPRAPAPDLSVPQIPAVVDAPTRAPAPEARLPEPGEQVRPEPPAAEAPKPPREAEVRAPPARAKARAAQPRPRMMSARVSGAPPRRTRDQAGAALATTAADTAHHTGAAIVLEGAAAVASLPDREPPQQLRQLISAALVPPLAAALDSERLTANSVPTSQPEPNAPPSPGAATPSQNQEPTTGITWARGREAAPNVGDPSSWLQLMAAPGTLLSAASVAEVAPPSEPGAKQRRWRGLGAGALALVGAVTCWVLWRGEPDVLPRERPAPAASAPTVVTDPSESATAPPSPAASVESPPARPHDVDTPSEAEPVAAEPSEAEPGEAERTAAEPRATTSSGSSSQRRAANRRAPRARAPKKVAAPKPVESASSVPQDDTKVKRVVSAVVQKAEKCDLWGRATGTAQLFITFEPSGKVKQARLVGEPIASAAVARCILHHARAATVPAFDGPALTVSRKLTLR